MVSHKAICEQLEFAYCLTVFQDFEELFTIFLVLKNLLLIDPSEHDMVNSAFAFLSGLSWHILSPQNSIPSYSVIVNTENRPLCQTFSPPVSGLNSNSQTFEVPSVYRKLPRRVNWRIWLVSISSCVRVSGTPSPRAQPARTKVSPFTPLTGTSWRIRSLWEGSPTIWNIFLLSSGAAVSPLYKAFSLESQ